MVRRHAPVLLAYFVLALLFTFPTIISGNEALVGKQHALESYWNIWWVAHSIGDLQQNPFDGTLLNAPFGVGLYFHTLNLLNGLLVLPIQRLFGTAIAYHSIVIFAFVMTATGAYALAYYLLKRRAAAVVAGLIYGFSPYMAFQLSIGLPALISLEWMPFYTLALLRGLRDRPRWLIVAALLLVAQALSDWHYTTFILVITALVALHEAVQLARGPAARRNLLILVGKLAAVGLGFGLLIAPVLVPMLREVAESNDVARPLDHSIAHSVDLLTFLVPSPHHFLWGEWARQRYNQLTVNYVTAGTASLGYLPLILAVVAVVALRRRVALPLLLFATFILLALGPFLRVNGQDLLIAGQQIPMPYLLFRDLPLMSIQRVPSRFVAAAMLGLALLAAFGLTWLLERPAIARRQLALFGLVGIVAIGVLGEYWPRPFPTTQIGTAVQPAFYQQLATQPKTGSIFEVPYLDDGEGYSMFYQTIHQSPTVGSRIARTVVHPWWAARYFAPLFQLQVPTPAMQTANYAVEARAALACQDVRYVVFYPGREADPSTQALLEQRYFGDQSPVYTDAILHAYDLGAETPTQPYWTTATATWHDAEYDAAGAYYWAKDGVGDLLIYPCLPAKTRQLSHLRLAIAGFGVTQTITVSLDDQPQAQVVVDPSAPRAIDLMLALHPGTNRVRLRSNAPPVSPAALRQGNDPRRLSFRVQQVDVTAQH